MGVKLIATNIYQQFQVKDFRKYQHFTQHEQATGFQKPYQSKSIETHVQGFR